MIISAGCLISVRAILDFVGREVKAARAKTPASRRRHQGTRSAALPAEVALFKPAVLV
jgi:hypothetical protein